MNHFLEGQLHYFGSSRRRKSLDRSSSIRKTVAAIVAEMHEMKLISNAKVSAATVDYIDGTKLVVPDRDSNSNSSRDLVLGTENAKGCLRSHGDGVKLGTFSGLLRGVLRKMKMEIGIAELRTCREGLIWNLGQS